MGKLGVRYIRLTQWWLVTMLSSLIYGFPACLFSSERLGSSHTLQVLTTCHYRIARELLSKGW
jgi:hypothetical protein